VALALAWLLAWVLYYGVRMKRVRTRRRIREVFPDISEKRVREIGFLALRNLLFNIVEMMRLERLTFAASKRRIEGYEAMVGALNGLRASSSAPRGLIVGTGHLGNWYLGVCAVARAGVPTFLITGRMRNPLINEWLTQMNVRCGINVYERGKVAMRGILERLRAGEVLGIMTDTRMPKPELSVSFLGKVANLGRGMASFARAENVPIVPTVFMRIGWTRFRLDTAAPVVPDMAAEKMADIERMTRDVVSSVERAILSAPEQWFGWYNGRWVFDPLRPSVATENVEGRI